MYVSPDGSGMVEVDRQAPFANPYTSDFSTGTEVPLEAIPAPGYRFDSWSGDLSGSTNPVMVTISCNKIITARFSRITHTLTMKADGGGSTIPIPGEHDYDEGMVVNISATADKGWRFAGWTGDVTDPLPATTTLTLDSDKVVTATFSQIAILQYTPPFLVAVIGVLVLAGLLAFLFIRRRAG